MPSPLRVTKMISSGVRYGSSFQNVGVGVERQIYTGDVGKFSGKWYAEWYIESSVAAYHELGITNPNIGTKAYFGYTGTKIQTYPLGLRNIVW